MAWFDGREPCSYLLDRAVNFVPEPMEFGYESELGQHALCFTCQDAVRAGDGAGHDARRRRVRPARRLLSRSRISWVRSACPFVGRASGPFLCSAKN